MLNAFSSSIQHTLFSIMNTKNIFLEGKLDRQNTHDRIHEFGKMQVNHAS